MAPSVDSAEQNVPDDIAGLTRAWRETAFYAVQHNEARLLLGQQCQRLKTDLSESERRRAQEVERLTCTLEKTQMELDLEKTRVQCLEREFCVAFEAELGKRTALVEGGGAGGLEGIGVAGAGLKKELAKVEQEKKEMLQKNIELTKRLKELSSLQQSNGGNSFEKNGHVGRSFAEMMSAGMFNIGTSAYGMGGVFYGGQMENNNSRKERGSRGTNQQQQTLDPFQTLILNTEAIRLEDLFHFRLFAKLGDSFMLLFGFSGFALMMLSLIMTLVKQWRGDGEGVAVTSTVLLPEYEYVKLPSI